MAFTAEVTRLVSDYIRERYNRHITPDQLLYEYEWHRIVSMMWDAKVFYKHPNWHKSLDEVMDPVEGKMYFIRTDDGVDNYEWQNGQWKLTGGVDENMYK